LYTLRRKNTDIPKYPKIDDIEDPLTYMKRRNDHVDKTGGDWLAK